MSRSEKKPVARASKPAMRALECSFCGIDRKRCAVLIAGPGLYICEECVSLCVEVIFEHDRSEYVDNANRVVDARQRIAAALMRIGSVQCTPEGRPCTAARCERMS